jgi:predicted peroxiredoxin
MYKYIKILIFTCILAIPFCTQGSERPKNLFVIVTTGDPITQLMSMVLATQSMNKGSRVDVLLCGEAGALAVENSPEVFLKPNNKSPQMLLKNLIKNGVSVEVCPPYLPNKGKAISDMIEGVAVAKPPAVADKLLHENTVILSY